MILYRWIICRQGDTLWSDNGRGIRNQYPGRDADGLPLSKLPEIFFGYPLPRSKFTATDPNGERYSETENASRPWKGEDSGLDLSLSLSLFSKPSKTGTTETTTTTFAARNAWIWPSTVNMTESNEILRYLSTQKIKNVTVSSSTLRFLHFRGYPFSISFSLAHEATVDIKPRRDVSQKRQAIFSVLFDFSLSVFSNL